MRSLLLILVFCSFQLLSCNETAKKKENTEDNIEPAVAPQSLLKKEGTSKLMDILHSYYALKDALVAAKAPEADKAANSLLAGTNAMQHYLQTDSIYSNALQPFLDTIKTGCTQAVSMMDESTEHKRIYFDKISGAVYSLLKKCELRNVVVYRQYCPMAMNDNGAYWLSNEPEIRNPYFGNKMLECGEITDTLK